MYARSKQPTARHNSAQSIDSFSKATFVISQKALQLYTKAQYPIVDVFSQKIINSYLKNCITLYIVLYQTLKQLRSKTF